MDLKELKELLELISERNIAEFELEEEGVKLKIKKGGLSPVGLAQPLSTPVVAASMPAPVETAVAHPLPETSTAADDGLSFVTSPMVGTFFRQPQPDAPPFASEGERVRKGQVLCIIEAMKLMNEIESEFGGELVQAFVENGQPVQFGDRLFAIRES